MTRRRLPLVGLRIDEPCSAPWEEMRPEPGGRHCESCNRVVRDFTRSTAQEAYGLAFLYGSHGLCGRLSVDERGDAVFRQRIPAPSPSLRRAALIAVGSSLVAGVGCADVPARPPESPIAVVHPAVVASAEIAPAPPVDTDHDGVSDAQDKCPDVAGEPTDGCPQSRRGIVITSSGDLTILMQPHFGVGSARVEKDSEPILESAVEALKAHPEILHVEVHGHTDARERNGEVLSRQRADNVIDWFVGHGIDRGRFIPLGDGSKLPVDNNATAKGRERNRRVELRIVQDPSDTST